MGAVILRILCIHGFRQHPIQFQGRTRAFQKRLRQYMKRVSEGHVECEFCFDAFGPYELPWYRPCDRNDGTLLEQSRPRLGWLLTEAQYKALECGHSIEEVDVMDEDQYSKQTYGWDTSIEVLDELLDTRTYDCVLGFSQGASVAALLCARECMRDEPTRRFKCSIIISGYPVEIMDEYLLQGTSNGKVNMPTMHIFGDSSKESQIPVKESQALADVFDARSRRILQTSQGHLVPSSREDIACIGDFLMKHWYKEQGAHA